MRGFWRLMTLMMLAGSLAVVSSAQSTTSLHGIVSDANGALLPGATVKISDPKTGFSRSVVSGPDGGYSVLQVPPSTYNLEVSAPGFAVFKRQDVTLQVSSPATFNVTMQVQGTSVQVEVTSEAPLVNTQDASLGNAFTERQLIRLPSEGRDPAAILSLQPGVTFIGGDKSIDQSNDSRGGSVSGARSDQTSITLDGLDDNEQLLGYAFQGALRSTLDSLQEFRVTTSNGNADEGRSSGGQVSLVTRSGTNGFHGTFYEYNRSKIGEANDWFNEAAQVGAGLKNVPPHLIRNTFGATFGGPIIKDRLFFFVAYEGQRKRETTQITQTVPSDLLRQGTMQYLCNPSADPNCIANTSPAPGISVTNAPAQIQTSDNLVMMQPSAMAAIDPYCSGNGTCPLGPGPNPLIAYLAGNPNSSTNSIFNLYPHANTDTAGDLLNYRGYTFAGSNPEKLNTYIVRLDYKLTANGNHSLFFRGNLQNDNQIEPPQFPGQPSNDFHTGNNKGIAAGYTALLSPTLINSFRWSLIREGVGDSGVNSQPFVHFRTLTDLTGLGFQSEYVNVPVHNFVDDVTWTRGKHTFQFGTNLRLVHNNRTGNFQNVSYAVTDPFSLDTSSGIANNGGSLDPATGPNYPAVDPGFGELYDFATMGLAGLVTVANVEFNQDKHGTQYAPGALIPRHFKAWEAEWYVQDAWRARPNLTITAGLRYSLLQPPYETSGNQAAPTVSIGDVFAQRARSQAMGQQYSPGQNATNGVSGGPPPIMFGLSGQANGKQPYWNWDYRNLAPRLALAYSPSYDQGFGRSLFGAAGKSSIRMGYGLYFDHFGEGLVNTFDKNGSFGLTTAEVNPYGVQDVNCAFRFTGINDLPQGSYCGQQMQGLAPGPFPVTPPLGVNAPGGYALYWGMDDKLKTPYSHVFNFAFTRDLGNDFALEISYVGRLGRHLLQETDLAMSQDIVDPKTHMDYFSAATKLAKLANANTPVDQVSTTNAGMYWQDLWGAAAGPAGSQLTFCGFPGESNLTGNVTATQAMYDSFACNVGNEILALQYADTPTFDPTGATCFPACSQLPGQSAPTPYNFFLPQFSDLWGWRSSGNSSYHAMNLTLRKALHAGVQFDVNYTYSKSIDVGSNAERVNLFDTNGTNVGGFSSQVINAWQPNQLKAVSDFDMTHQINSNWVVDLPVGRDKKFGSGMGRAADLVFGGWTITGLFHWSSGLPFSIFPGGGWSTNYDLQGEAIEIANPGKVGVHRNASGNPTMFADGQAVTLDFRHPYPGESGQRNELRGPGYFGIDAGLDKDWKIREGQTLSFAWETFNVTNAVRFDAALSSNNFDLTSSTNFGVYSSTLTQPRVMQFMLRYTF